MLIGFELQVVFFFFYSIDQQSPLGIGSGVWIADCDACVPSARSVHHQAAHCSSVHLCRLPRGPTGLGLLATSVDSSQFQRFHSRLSSRKGYMVAEHSAVATCAVRGAVSSRTTPSACQCHRRSGRSTRSVLCFSCSSWTSTVYVRRPHLSFVYEGYRDLHLCWRVRFSSGT